MRKVHFRRKVPVALTPIQHLITLNNYKNLLNPLKKTKILTKKIITIPNINNAYLYYFLSRMITIIPLLQYCYNFRIAIDKAKIYSIIFGENLSSMLNIFLSINWYNKYIRPT